MQREATAGIHLSMLHARKVLKEPQSFQTSTSEEINGANRNHLSVKGGRTSLCLKNKGEGKEEGVWGKNKPDM